MRYEVTTLRKSKNYEVKTLFTPSRVVSFKNDPKTYEVNRTPVNITINNTIGTTSGWANYVNTLHTEQNPFTFQSGVPFIFPIRFDIGDLSQATDALENFIDNDTNELRLDNLNNGFTASLEWKMESSTPMIEGTVSIKTDGVLKNPSDFVGGAVDTTKLLKSDFLFYQKEDLATFEAVINGNGAIWDIELTVFQIHQGDNATYQVLT